MEGTLLCFLIAGVIGALTWSGWQRETAFAALRSVLLGGLLGGLAFSYLGTLELNTRWSWSAARLAPTIGMFQGYPLYSPIANGPINGWLYGPVAALAWTPAALADSPLPALWIAAVINVVFLIVPLVWAAKPYRRGAGEPGIICAVGGAAALLQIYPTWYMASVLNADAPAVGLGAASCLMLLRAAPGDWKKFSLAAGLGALATWTKQIEAPLVLAQLAWLWLRHGGGASLHFAALHGIGLFGVGLLVAIFMQPGDVIFNMWTIPTAHAHPGGWRAALQECVDFARYGAFLWIPLLLGGWWLFRQRAASPGWQTISAPLLLVLAAAVLVPTGVAATIKVGGDRNSIHSVYYLVIATVLLFREILVVLPARHVARWAVVAAVIATTGFAMRQVNNYPKLSMLPPRCLSQESWNFTRAHAEIAYFPKDPLATMMAGGRMYHFEYGVQDRIYAGRAPDHAHIFRHLPLNMALVVYPRAPGPYLMLEKYFPGYVFGGSETDWLIARAPRAK